MRISQDNAKLCCSKILTMKITNQGTLQDSHRYTWCNPGYLHEIGALIKIVPLESRPC